MTNYAKTAARADQSLRRKGGIVTLRQVVTGEYDTDTGTTAATTTNYDGTGIKIGYSADMIDGTLIQSGDQQLLLSPLQRDGSPMPAPTSADLALIGTATFVVKSIDKTEPTDTAVLYVLQLRGL